MRDLTLNEDIDQFGRLIQRLGTTDPLYDGTYARNYEDAPTETPAIGSIEAWRIFNLTGDTHPIHFHLVNVQIVSRQKFIPAGCAGRSTKAARRQRTGLEGNRQDEPRRVHDRHHEVRSAEHPVCGSAEPTDGRS